MLKGVKTEVLTPFNFLKGCLVLNAFKNKITVFKIGFLLFFQDIN